MEKVVLFLVVFIGIYLMYLVTILTNKKKMNSFTTSNQCLYFINRYKLDFKKINVKVFANKLFLLNSFIISITMTIIDFVDNLILKLLVGFLILIPLILVSYHILAILYKKKEGK